jgi:hypothetical protein
LSFARDAAGGTPCKWAAKIEKNNCKKQGKERKREGLEKRKERKGNREVEGQEKGREQSVVLRLQKQKGPLWKQKAV